MLLAAALLRVPAPIPPRPLRRRLLQLAPMATHTDAKSPDATPPAPAPQPPEKPLPGDCCGSGCVRCVWDVYYDELDAYNKALAARSSSPDAPSDGKASTADGKAKS